MKRRCDLRLVILLLILFALLIECILVGRHVYALWTHGMRLKALARNPGDALQAGGPARIQADLAAVEQALRGLRSQLSPILRPAWLPWAAARDNLFAVDELLKTGIELAQAGRVAGSGLQAIVDALPQPRRPEAGQDASQAQSTSEALLVGLVNARPSFQQAERQIAASYQSLHAALPARSLWQPLAQLVAVLDRYLPPGRAALGAAAAAPALLGETGPANYLLLAQNNDELRPTGGFITGGGLVTVEHGKIGQLNIVDSYEFDKFSVDHPFAPEPMQRYMGIILWVTRDGNFWPDFPTSAQAVEDLYHLENSGAINGVVAVDMLALQQLLTAIGPVQLEGYAELIGGDNLVQKVREYWSPELPEEASSWNEKQKRAWIKGHHKDFLGPLGRAVMRKVQTSRPQEMGKLLQAVQQALDEKHLLVYFHEPAVQELLAIGGWDGTVNQTAPGDYLLAVDMNMGYNKVNANVEKAMEYRVALSRDEPPQATLTITYYNQSPAQPVCRWRFGAQSYSDRMRGCYWNYLRVYVPQGSQLLAAEGLTETVNVAGEAGKTVFCAYLVVPGGETRTVRFTYKLPDWGLQEYQLLIQKQAGTDAVPCSVQIALPEGVRIALARPQPESRQAGVLYYDLKLRRDRALSLALRSP